ncbi:hypothetical protein VTN31DRAFT_4092 [Thermomyces dupontii]|uniref:uncharacterized protein n=1 Tax=Talaromyces thermophilus TaxID=28565 RepID=UPI0037449D75
MDEEDHVDSLEIESADDASDEASIDQPAEINVPDQDGEQLQTSTNDITAQTSESAPENNNNQSQVVSRPGRSILADIPPNIAQVRQLLFECADRIELTVTEFERFWPFVDNVWVKQRTNASKSGRCTSEYYICRLRRPTVRPQQQQQQQQTERKRARRRTVRERSMCNVSIKVVHNEGPLPGIVITRTPGSDRHHRHDLDYIDKIKRNSGLMELVRNEACKGFLPSSVFHKLREEPNRLAAAGGNHLTVTDVRNASAKWRMQNPDVELVPHPGFQYQLGFGIVKIQPSDQQQQQGEQQSAEEELAPARHLPPGTLPFPPTSFSLDFLGPYLPPPAVTGSKPQYPHVTVSYASSMDGRVSLTPGAQTILSGPEANLMTHYLRSRHDAILIGVGTMLADNPQLNCRLEGAGGYGGLSRMWHPRPVIIDPLARWDPRPETSRLMQAVVDGRGRPPWVIVAPNTQVPPDRVVRLKGYGGDYLCIMEVRPPGWRLRWQAILHALTAEGIRSVLVEGGGRVLSDLLSAEHAQFVDSVVVTLAPTFLGAQGVGVAPAPGIGEMGAPVPPVDPRDVTWTFLGKNAIMCGKVGRREQQQQQQEQEQGTRTG